MKILTRSLLLLLLFATSACEKYVEIAPAPQLLQSEQLFSSEPGVTATVNGLYSYMRAGSIGFLNGAMSIYGGLSVGEIYNTATSVTYDPFAKNMIPNNNGTISSIFWSNPYNMIYRCNVILEGVEKSEGLSQKFKDQVRGEMLLVRSLVYFYLVNIYGSVPLILTTNYALNATMGRTSVEEIYQHLISDLKLSKGLLTASYPSAGKTRPNLYTAMALLARVYLYHKDYQDAYDSSDFILKNGPFALTSDLSRTFLINSPETIWEVAAPAEGRNSTEGALYIPFSATSRPTFAVPEKYVNLFDANDKRKSTWLLRNTSAGISYYYPAKFRNRLTTPLTEYNVVFRLSEIYMIKAESAAQLNDLASAQLAVNTIRRRAGLNDLSSNLLKPALLDAILQERQKEFVGEWGHRWFDLKRLSLITGVLSTEKPSFKPSAQWFPIPVSQINLNQNLIQNEGY